MKSETVLKQILKRLEALEQWQNNRTEQNIPAIDSTCNQAERDLLFIIHNTILSPKKQELTNLIRAGKNQEILSEKISKLKMLPKKMILRVDHLPPIANYYSEVAGGETQ